MATAAQNAAPAPISSEEILRAKSAANQPSKSDFKVLNAIPADMQQPNFWRKSLGNPVMISDYQNADGSTCFFFCRYQNKDFLPFVAVQKEDGSIGWANKFPSGKRPLLNLPEILKSDKILVCEGEKTADRLQSIAKGMVVTTSVGGSNAAHNSDWSPLKGKKVVIVRDNDEQGRKYQNAVIRLCQDSGSKSIHVLEPDAYKSDLPQGWDWGDAVTDAGLTTQVFYELMGKHSKEIAAPKKAALSLPSYNKFTLKKDGVYRVQVDEEGNRTDWFISTPIEVVARTVDSENENWGYLIELRDPNNNLHEIALPSNAFFEDPNGTIGRLNKKGLIVLPVKGCKELLLEYLITRNPEARVRCVSQVGWHGDTFVLPDETFGGNEDERCTLQSKTAVPHAFSISGTFEEWQNIIAKPAQGNSRFALCLGVGFSAPLAKLVNAESGGFHLRGSSSIGKSTGGLVAGSIYGGGDDADYVKSWRMTDNGGEGVCASLNDCLGVFDELGQASAKTVWEAVYMFSNQQGKTRADRQGNARATYKWRIQYISNGEIDIEEKIREDGKNRILMAGMEVRIVTVDANVHPTQGIYETLNGFADGAALSNHFKENCNKYYGTAGRKFIRYLAENKEEAIQFVKAKQQEFISGLCPADVDGQVKRVAARFALAAASGELAIKIGILPWNAGDMFVGVHACFLNWLENRGSVKASSEEIRGVQQVIELIEKYGASRFDDISTLDKYGKGMEYAQDKAHERWGWRELIDGQWVYFVTTAGIKELTRGFSQKVVLQALSDQDILELPNGKGLQKSKHIPTEGKARKTYWLHPSKAENQDD